MLRRATRHAASHASHERHKRRQRHFDTITLRLVDAAFLRHIAMLMLLIFRHAITTLLFDADAAFR